MSRQYLIKNIGKGKGKRDGPSLYNGHGSLVVDINNPKYGLQSDSLESCHCSSFRPGFVSDTSRKQLILDFENSTIRLPVVTENTKVFSFGSHLGNTQIVMDFENSKLYTPSIKEGASSIATRSVTSLGVSSMYVDIGDCQWSYNHCSAMFWYGERLKGYVHARLPKYHKCCGGGKIVLRQQRDPIHYMKQLLKDHRFLDNIQGYSCDAVAVILLWLSLSLRKV
ncbi:hypothetical protein Tco_0357273, partial [Tanacetum coccineum]